MCFEFEYLYWAQREEALREAEEARCAALEQQKIPAPADAPLRPARIEIPALLRADPAPRAGVGSPAH